MTAPDFKAMRRQFLAHCLAIAKVDEKYAIWAAADYERRWPTIFQGLKDRFDTDLSRMKADAEATA